MRMSPMTVPMRTRIAGVMRLLSKEYFTRNTIPRKRTNPPIHAKSFTPKNASQSNGFDGTGGGGGIAGGRGGPGGTRFGGAGGGPLTFGSPRAAGTAPGNRHRRGGGRPLPSFITSCRLDDASPF